MRCQLIAVLLCIFLIGCEPPPKAMTPAKPGAVPGTPPAPPPPPGVIPASEATGVWSQAQVEEFLKQEFALTTISLQSTGNHGYQGTGTDAEGIAYKLIVKQVPGGIKIDWTTSSGNGKITFGNPVP